MFVKNEANYRLNFQEESYRYSASTDTRTKECCAESMKFEYTRAKWIKTRSMDSVFVYFIHDNEPPISLGPLIIVYRLSKWHNERRQRCKNELVLFSGEQCGTTNRSERE